jgi:hypothetical protein
MVAWNKSDISDMAHGIEEQIGHVTIYGDAVGQNGHTAHIG